MNHRRVGIVLALAGVLSLLGLRLWSGPVGQAVTGRSTRGSYAFMAIPLLLLVVGAGIALAVWGDDLGNG